MTFLNDRNGNLHFFCLQVMGKTRAEIQKSYRERKKAAMGEAEYTAYKRRESKRVMEYFVPMYQSNQSEFKA